MNPDFERHTCAPATADPRSAGLLLRRQQLQHPRLLLERAGRIGVLDDPLHPLALGDELRIVQRLLHRRLQGSEPRRRDAGRRTMVKRPPLTIEGEPIAKSTGTVSAFAVGDRVFHIKFGNGNVVAVDGNTLTIAFDKAREKRVVDRFVEKA
jgi:hypothetical protein